jgi:hypothetical protein
MHSPVTDLDAWRLLPLAMCDVAAFAPLNARRPSSLCAGPIVMLDQTTVSTAAGGKAKFNRKTLGVPKTHALDAVCVGEVASIKNWRQPVLTIRCTGRGAYKRTRLTKHGFPRGYLMRQKSAFGFSTGDMVIANVPTGKKAGTHRGRVAIRAFGSFNVTTSAGVIQGLSHRHMRLIRRADGYGYSTSMPHKTVLLPGLKAGVSARKERR